MTKSLKGYRRSHKSLRKYHNKYRKRPIQQLKTRIYRHEATRAAKIDIINRYSGGKSVCCQCGHGDLDTLQLDHTNYTSPDRLRKRKTGMRYYTGCFLYAWLKKRGYPSGYQVLCANCNVKKEAIRVREAWEHRLMQQLKTIPDAVSLTIK